MSNQNIIIKGARVNNLKNVDVEIPRNKFVVITGLSGSGKSSLAFDTLYAEGQRRYVESLSAYARQFLGRMSKPEVDFIKGLPPAIAVEQKVNTHNPRSTVGTSTEIYDYMRLLFARVGKTYSPVSGVQVKKHTEEDVIAAAQSYPEGTRIAVTAPLVIRDGEDANRRLTTLRGEGFSRLFHDGEFVMIDDVIEQIASEKGSKKRGTDISQYQLLVDRLAVAGDGDELSRLADSVETAFFEGDNRCSLFVWGRDGIHRHDFSHRFEADGIVFKEPNEQMFNFNNPVGACPVCEGFGKTVGIDEHKLIPNKALSVYQD
ncbi:MAG: excinuclease ABC subunit A, partial [Muribaculaceae bacterium]|nr:excinuclease ABC subunit A [Muribaculaceae bacterium]